MEHGQWLKRAHNMNAARVEFVTALKKDLIEYEEAIIFACVEMSEDPLDDASSEEVGEEYDVLLAREKRQREAAELVKVLGDSSLSGDRFFDYCEILWMLQGKWGRDHPY
ncbi:hypothetical protein PV325_011432 [Microctonus aethiopoides]|nr:hypothetical protein PV325_011432 [Microctonus aethiopoides]